MNDLISSLARSVQAWADLVGGAFATANAADGPSNPTANLDERTLRDIGLTRVDAEFMTSRRRHH